MIQRAPSKSLHAPGAVSTEQRARKRELTLGSISSLPKGIRIAAAFSGNVYEIRENDKSLGKSVFVRGENGITAIYSHLDTIDVKHGSYPSVQKVRVPSPRCRRRGTGTHRPGTIQ